MVLRGDGDVGKFVLRLLWVNGCDCDQFFDMFGVVGEVVIVMWYMQIVDGNEVYLFLFFDWIDVWRINEFDRQWLVSEE